jgi:hypothetical protein
MQFLPVAARHDQFADDNLRGLAVLVQSPNAHPDQAPGRPTRAIRVKRPGAAPTGIDWTRLRAEDLEEMPILADLRRMTTSNT